MRKLVKGGPETHISMRVGFHHIQTKCPSPCNAPPQHLTPSYSPFLLSDLTLLLTSLQILPLTLQHPWHLFADFSEPCRFTGRLAWDPVCLLKGTAWCSLDLNPGLDPHYRSPKILFCCFFHGFAQAMGGLPFRIPLSVDLAPRPRLPMLKSGIILDSPHCIHIHRTLYSSFQLYSRTSASHHKNHHPRLSSNSLFPPQGHRGSFLTSIPALTPPSV